MSDDLDFDEPRRGGRLVTFLVALVAVGVFAGGLWFAYDRGLQRGSGGPPLIKADTGPTKVAPENPGGLQVPNQNMEVYGTVQKGSQPAKPAVEKILPPPEQPAAVPPRSAAAPPPPPAPSLPTPSPPAPSAAGLPAAAPPAGPTISALNPPPPPTSNPPAVPPLPAQVASVAPAASAGAIRIQLAAHREAAQAEAEWVKLQKRFAAELTGLSPAFERADLGERGVFIRVQAGPFKDRNAAVALCEQLKAQKQGCSVVGK
jgi:hypothetical protein